ncbi:unnamed protein product, partial [Rotaria sp. Silwood2]
MAIMVDNVYGSCLQVKILSAHSVFDKTQDVVVEMQYNNTSNEIISIYKWCLPSNELNDPLFKVTCNNVPVRYVGPLIKRREPTIEDMTPLEPGKTKIIQARLSSAYDMTKTGIYSIQYDMPAERVVFKHARTFENVLFRTISKRHSGLESNNIQLIIEDRLNIQREQNRNMNVIKRAATLSYVSCSIIQKSQITNAIPEEKFESGFMLWGGLTSKGLIPATPLLIDEFLNQIIPEYMTIFPYEAQQDDELRFPADAILEILHEANTSGWFKARFGNQVGLISSTYVQPIDTHNP